MSAGETLVMWGGRGGPRCSPYFFNSCINGSASATEFHTVINTLRGLNFARIKFCGFREFRKNREIKSRRKI